MRLIETKRGSFGLVLILEKEDGTKIARKTLSPKQEVTDETEKEKLLKRFSREVHVQQGLPDDFFLPILEAHLKESPPWFVMPCAEMTFLEYINISRKLCDLKVFIEPLCDILNALEYMHTLDYTHRDLKPENIMLHHSKWKLSDFGLVSPGDSITAKLTSNNSAWGSANYCAPEQFTDFAHVTPAADIYSFGCILHDVFDGSPRVPYRKYTSAGMVGTVIEKCTEEDPKKRFKSIASLRSALLLALDDQTPPPPSSTTENWINKLTTIATWESNDHAGFVQHLRTPLSKLDQQAIFRAIDEDALTLLHEKNDLLGNLISELYCERAGNDSHIFAYCDVVGHRLFKIFELESLSLKCMAVIAAAKMASKHNRWFVMKMVIKEVSPEAEANFIKRLAIEISAEEAEEAFRECAQGISKSVGACYHPLLCKVLSPEPDIDF